MSVSPSTAVREVGPKYKGAAIKCFRVTASTVSTAIAGTGYNLLGGYRDFSVQITGLITGSKVLLQGSLTGSDWVTLGSTAGYTSTARTVVRSTNATPVQFVRLYGTTVSTGANRSVTGYICALGAGG